MDIRLGFIGLGKRGMELFNNTLSNFPSAKIVAACDGVMDKAVSAARSAFEKTGNEVKAYSDYAELLKDENVNTVIISTTWEARFKIAIASILAGKATALEVGGAYSLNDCWQLINAVESTGVPFMFLENCCFGKFELSVTNMVRKGVFGEVSYCHGSYCHDLRKQICDGVKTGHYQLANYIYRNCESYPTHELGPIAKILNINRSNRMVSLCSLSSKSKGLKQFIKGKEEYAALNDVDFKQGDIVQTLIKCYDGSLISIKLDTTLPHPYSREFTVSGTKAVAMEQGKIIYVDDGKFSGMANDRIGSMDKYLDQYMPDVWKNITEKEIESGNFGMDALMLKAFYGALEADGEMPIDVYDACTLMAVTCLSEQSILKGGSSVEIPDFTGGKWITRKPKDVVDM